MAQPLELKKTLNLPKTDFPMKAGLPQNEPRQLEAWHNGNIYEGILEARKGKPPFVLHDGPPYPTGEIHLGTGLNKILKDLIVKTRAWRGTTRRTCLGGIATACRSRRRWRKNSAG